jgi:hypothetical protein
MWVDLGTEVQARMRDQVREADRRRLVARARADRSPARRSPAGYGWRLRQAAAFGLLRTGLWLFDTRRA